MFIPDQYAISVVYVWLYQFGSFDVWHNFETSLQSSNAVEPLGSSIERPMNNEAPNNSDNQNAGNSCENSSSEVQPVPSLPTQGMRTHH